MPTPGLLLILYGLGTPAPLRGTLFPGLGDYHWDNGRSVPSLHMFFFIYIYLGRFLAFLTILALGQPVSKNSWLKMTSSYILTGEETGRKKETVQSCSPVVNPRQEFHRVSCLTQSSGRLIRRHHAHNLCRWGHQKEFPPRYLHLKLLMSSHPDTLRGREWNVGLETTTDGSQFTERLRILYPIKNIYIYIYPQLK